MRALIAFAALALGGTRAPAQQGPASAAPGSRPAQATGDTAQQHPTPARDSAHLKQEIDEHRAAGETYLPDADNFTWGDRTIAAGTRVDGPVAVAHGNLDVFGTVNGDVVALGGDVRVHQSALVTGDAFAAGGRVIIDGGAVEGERRAVAISRPALPGMPAAPSRPLSTLQSVKLVVAWFALLTLIGLGVMVFAEGNLDGVVIALERGFARSFWLGLAGQVVLLPGLLVLVVGLTITVIGILLIPFAVVAYIIAAAGLVTLGFLAVARLTGGAMASDRGTTSKRGVHLRALAIGLIAYLGIWLVAALFTWNPVVGAILRGIAFAITWVAGTVGLGATLASRAGTQRPGAGTSGKTTTDDYSWQTPTPVSGVAAATRKLKVGAS
jgi:hypothetical protein